MRKSAYPAPGKSDEDLTPETNQTRSKPKGPPPYRPPMPLWSGFLIAGIPALFMAVGIWAGWNDSRFEREARHAEAEIISIRTESAGGSRNSRGEIWGNTSTAVYPTVRYTTESGETYTVEAETNRGGQAIRDQTWIRVAYMPDDPTRVRISRGVWDTWKQPLAIVVPCLLLIAGTIWLFRWLNRRERAKYEKRWGVAP
ncbi:MAG: DUF3592 domain-containing protein [Pseudomonadota bacterium]